jgi:hypothetical protein
MLTSLLHSIRKAPGIMASAQTVKILGCKVGGDFVGFAVRVGLLSYRHRVTNLPIKKSKVIHSTLDFYENMVAGSNTAIVGNADG